MAVLAVLPYTTAAVVMIAISFSSKRFQERHLHAAIPTAAAAVVLGWVAAGYWLLSGGGVCEFAHMIVFAVIIILFFWGKKNAY